ncbi:S-adenosyl-L-methionine-dependent methyltransferase [Cladochytrium replicatum]|nr:S-adenosyl-L-methionine-dependent methyltransferase [Cladochytrium replicatum]
MGRLNTFLLGAILLTLSTVGLISTLQNYTRGRDCENSRAIKEAGGLPENPKLLEDPRFWRNRYIEQISSKVIDNRTHDLVNTNLSPDTWIYLPFDEDNGAAMIRNHRKGWSSDCLSGGMVLSDLILNQRPRFVVEVGASYGACTLYYANAQLRVVAFEPQSHLLPPLFASISVNAHNFLSKSAESVTIVPLAAGVPDNRLSWMTTQVGDLGNGIVLHSRQTRVDYVVSYAPGRRTRKWTTEEVDVVRIDDVVSERVGFMRVDTPGSELSVIRSSEKLIKGAGVDQIGITLYPWYSFAANSVEFDEYGGSDDESGAANAQAMNAFAAADGKMLGEVLYLLDDWGYVIKRESGDVLPRDRFNVFIRAIGVGKADVVAYSKKIFPDIEKSKSMKILSPNV